VPAFIAPKLASSVAEPPTGPLWIHELKLDGYRVQLHVRDGSVRLFTRNGLDWTARFPTFLQSAAVRSRIEALDDAVLDGELTMVDEHGLASFSALQQSMRSGRTAQHVLAYFAFDLLYCDGRWLLDEPLLRRKQLLQQWHAGLGISEIQYLDHVAGSGQQLLELCRLRGLEGIVSKRLDRPYRSGRSVDWLKCKIRLRESFVIGGYEIKARGEQLTNLLVGAPAADGRLTFVGRVGSGWTMQQASELVRRLDVHRTHRSPFLQALPPARTAGVRSDQASETRWLQPVATVEVSFAGWTESELLRQPALASMLLLEESH
jgi:bifunctional non-homologous end joining protein LigD